MTGRSSGIARRRPLTVAVCAGASLILALLIGGTPLANREAMAITAVGAAARSSDAELNKCAGNTGKALYGCVATVLSGLCYQIGKTALPPAATQQFDGAIGRLRVAASKVEALSALAQARAAISSALQQARSVGSVRGGSADAQDLAAIAAVVSHAVQLVQSKG